MVQSISAKTFYSRIMVDNSKVQKTTGAATVATKGPKRQKALAAILQNQSKAVARPRDPPRAVATNSSSSPWRWDLKVKIRHRVANGMLRRARK